MSGTIGDNVYRASGVVAAASAGGTSWQSVETGATFTAVAGNGYPVNTTAQACTVTLPAGSVGDTIQLVDYAGTWDTNNCNLTADGSEKIKGSTTDGILSGEREAVTITYVDATQGWVTTSAANDNDSAIQIPEYLAATGPDGASGVTDGNYKVHIFTATKAGSDGFSVSAGGNSAGSNTVEYLVIAGGGGGKASRGSGGGAGGMLTATGLSVTAQDYTITIGAGGTAGTVGGTVQGGDGSDSVFSTITSTGGGGQESSGAGRDGGSGGGAMNDAGADSFGEGTTGQGNDGGDGKGAPQYGAGGGGGKGAIGADGTTANGGAGGAGGTSDIVEAGTDVTYAGGGGGSVYNTGSGGAGGSGGGGAGGTQTVGTAGTANTGGGGGGGGITSDGSTALSAGAGGSGYVVIRYKFQ